MAAVTQFTNGNDVKISDILEKMNGVNYADGEEIDPHFLRTPLDSIKDVNGETKFLANSSGMEFTSGSVSDFFNEMNRDPTAKSGKEYVKDFDDFHSMIRQHLKVNDSEMDLSGKLILAAGKGDINACNELVCHPNFKHFVDIPDESGFTALNYAVTYGHPLVAKLLVQNGATSDTASITDFINMGDIDPELLRDTNPDFSESIDHDDSHETPEYSGINTMGMKPSDENEILEDISSLPDSLNVVSDCQIVDVDPKQDTLERMKKSVQDTNNFETSFRRNAKLKGMFGISAVLDNLKEKSSENLPGEEEEREVDFDKVVSEIDTLDQIAKNVEISKKPPLPKKKVTKNSGGFAKSFASNMKKNFSKSGFSDDRVEPKKLVIPQREETTPKQMEEILRQFEKLKANDNSYAAINSRTIQEFTDRDVSLLLIDQDKIEVSIQEHRNKMLPGPVDKEALLTHTKKVMRKQINGMGNKRIQRVVDDIHEVLLFYRDVFSRMVDLNKSYVKASPVHGNGVFASQNLKRGDIVTFYFPYLLEYMYEDNENKQEAFVIVPVISKRDFTQDLDQLHTLRKGTIKLSDTMMLVGDDQYYADSRFIGHIINDPCDFTKGKVTTVDYEKQIMEKANASLITYSKDKRFMYVIATKDIAKDEEVFVPYGCRFWEIPENEEDVQMNVNQYI